MKKQFCYSLHYHTTAFSQTLKKSKRIQFRTIKVAIQGYDPVAYFYPESSERKIEYYQYYEGEAYNFHHKPTKDLFKNSQVTATWRLCA
jgi:hypothetical protein